MRKNIVLVSLFTIGSLIQIATASADTCPQIEGKYSCLVEAEPVNVIIFQMTVSGVEKYQVPLLDGQGTVIADGQKHGGHDSYTIANCVGNKLKVEENKKSENPPTPAIVYSGKYEFYLNQAGALVYSVSSQLTIGTQTSYTETKLVCKLVPQP